MLQDPNLNLNFNYIILTDVGSLDYGSSISVSSTNSYVNNSYSFLYADGSGDTLDLTHLTLNGTFSQLNIGTWYGSSNVTVVVDDASLAHFNDVYGSNAEHLSTAAATLDLTQKSISGSITVESTNATGTAFTVADLNTGLHVIGGAGNDTLVAQGFTFSSGQRAAIFAQGSVETITDLSGMYSNPN